MGKNKVREAVDEIQRAIDEAVEDLSDSEYLEVLEETIGNLETSVDAKKSEM